MNSDDDRHITRVSKVSENVLSAQRESSHLTAILGDKSLESFWLQVTEASTRFRDKDSLGSCSWISGRRVGCGQGFVIVWLHLPFLSVLPSTALPTHWLQFPSDRKAAHPLPSWGEGGGIPWVSTKRQGASSLEATATFSLSLAGISHDCS